MVFGDEFDANGLNPKKWATCFDLRKSSETGCTNDGNLEQQWYPLNQPTVANGQLKIVAQKKQIDVAIDDKARTFDYTSGMINSGSGGTDGSIKWAGTYGYFEAKIKFQDGKGIAPAFRLQPVDKNISSEIDIMEFTGDKPNQILQTLYYQKDGQAEKSAGVIKKPTEFSNGWHVYGVNWTKDRIDWYIDGKLTRSYTGDNIPDRPMEVVINLAVGGLLAGDTDILTPFPNNLSVDYVHVYQAADQVRTRAN